MSETLSIVFTCLISVSFHLAYTAVKLRLGRSQKDAQAALTQAAAVREQEEEEEACANRPALVALHDDLCHMHDDVDLVVGTKQAIKAKQESYSYGAFYLSPSIPGPLYFTDEEMRAHVVEILEYLTMVPKSGDFTMPQIGEQK